MTRSSSVRFCAAVLIVALTTLVASCGLGKDPFDSTGAESSKPGGPVVVGSQAYYSNEIIAEVYAQALEAHGFDVDRHFHIGQRDAYIPALRTGEVQILPDYTGNLLQFFDASTTARTPDEVESELHTALPEGLSVLHPAAATDQDTYTVTQATAQAYGLRTIADLAKLDHPRLGGPAELEARPYGPQGLAQTYGVNVEFRPTGDTTVDALVAGRVDVANVFSADPRIDTDNLVVLQDPEDMFISSQVVPIVASSRVADVGPVIDQVSAAMGEDDLIAFNVASTKERRSNADIARSWLESKGLL